MANIIKGVERILKTKHMGAAHSALLKDMSVDELTNLKGIGTKTAEKIRSGALLDKNGRMSTKGLTKTQVQSLYDAVSSRGDILDTAKTLRSANNTEAGYLRGRRTGSKDFTQLSATEQHASRLENLVTSPGNNANYTDAQLKSIQRHLNKVRGEKNVGTHYTDEMRTKSARKRELNAEQQSRNAKAEKAAASAPKEPEGFLGKVKNFFSRWRDKKEELTAFQQKTHRQLKGFEPGEEPTGKIAFGDTKAAHEKSVYQNTKNFSQELAGAKTQEEMDKLLEANNIKKGTGVQDALKQFRKAQQEAGPGVADYVEAYRGHAALAVGTVGMGAIAAFDNGGSRSNAQLYGQA